MVQHTMTGTVAPLPVEERELVRQLQVTRLLLEEMGGSLPRELLPAKPLRTVLDVACGAGGWALDVAQTYPSLRVTGIDSSEPHVAYAQRLATEGGLVNVHFLTQDMRTLEAGPFESDSFDLINVSFIASALLETDYAALMRSLWRLCRPGGMLRWTEMELPLTNSPAFEQFMALVCQALDAAGQTFVPPDMQRSAAIFDDWRRTRGLPVTPYERRHLGITPIMGSWLREAGCRTVDSCAHAVEVSTGTKAHPHFLKQVVVFGQQMTPFLCKQGVIPADDLSQLLWRVQQDIQHADFCGLCLLLTMHGFKAA